MSNDLKNNTVPAQEQRWASYVRRIAQGDEAALDGLMEDTRSFVVSIAGRILPSHAEGEEIVSNVYMQVWRTASSFDPDRGRAGAWLGSIARTRAIDRVRKKSHRAEGQIEEFGAVRCPGPSPESLAGVEQMRRQVRDAMECLPVQELSLIRMAYHSGLTHSEIADEVKLPLGTVKSRIRQGMIRLRQEIEARGFSREHAV